MRVTAGDLKGRQIVAPHNRATHPMGDRVRGALFNILGDIEGLTVLDAFAGSGALAIEAVSRGVASVIAVETDKAACMTITRNVTQLDIGLKVKVTRANVSSWSSNNPDQTFDLILCDPPYDQLQLAVLTKLVGHVAYRGIYVLSWPGGLDAPEFPGMEQIELRSYGDARLVFYKKF